MPPRPIASAAPGGTATPARRDDRQQQSGGGHQPGGAHVDRSRRKKGKRGAVDQEAVDANISKTMATLRGAPQRRSASDMRRGVREEMEAARAAEIERERKNIRVNEFITVSELAQILKVPATEIVAFAFKNLSDEQKRMIVASVKDAKTAPPKGTVPPEAYAKPSMQLPSSADLRALPDAVTAQMPELKGYRYNNVDGKVLLVDPKTYAVVAVLGE